MEFLKKAAPRPPEEAEERSRSVAGIIRDIRTRGDAALAGLSVPQQRERRYRGDLFLGMSPGGGPSQSGPLRISPARRICHGR